MYTALKRHDYAALAATKVAERESAGLPTSSHLAQLRAEARDYAVAAAFLAAAAQACPVGEGVTAYPVVPLPVKKVAGVERLQMLVQCPQRARLQRLLPAWGPQLQGLRPRGLARRAIDVDPLGI